MRATTLDGAELALRDRARLERARRLRRSFPCAELRDEPVGFARQVLFFNPWDRQAEWMQALVPEQAAVSVVSGHKTGKSTGAAGSGLWFWGTRRRARVVLMAPKIEHIEIVLWPEIRRLFLGAGRCPTCRAIVAAGEKPPPPCPQCSPLGDPAWIGMDPTKGLRAPDGREIFAYTSRKPDAIGGISGPEMFFIFDEASGVEDEVFEAMKGNEAGGVRKLLLGNGLGTTGEFYDSHHRGRRFYTYAASISSEHTPNVVAGEKLLPGLATLEWVEKRAEDWGRDSVVFAVRVKGLFPKHDEGQLVPIDVLDAAQKRWETAPEHGRLQLGVDVAFTGDDAAIAARRGQKILEVTSLHGLDEYELATHVVSAARANRRQFEPRPLVLYDSNGVGSRLGRALQEYSSEIEAKGINGTWAPRRPREYLQLRDEIACNFARWLKAGAIPMEGRLEGEISNTKAYDGGKGRKRVISNDELKKILKRSPDRRNACELAVWEPASLAHDDPSGPRQASQGVPDGRDMAPAGPYGTADAGLQRAWGQS